MSGITLHMAPHVSPMTWKEFIKYRPDGYSIAADGFVRDSTKFDIVKGKPYANFDHHEKVNRLATRATCGQAALAIRMGLVDAFRDSNGNVKIELCFNDPDEDVCMTYALFKNFFRTKNLIDPALNRLISMADYLDATAGAYPLSPDMQSMREIAWVFEPYRRARVNGLLATKNAQVYIGIVTDVEQRIMAHICGHGGAIDYDTRYEVLGSGKALNGQGATFSVIKEIGIHSRTGIYADGVKAYVSVRERDNGNYDYAIGKVSPFITGFPLDKIFSALNTIEGCSTDCWGGADTIGGSPRTAGSAIKPQQLIDIINSLGGQH